MESNPRDYGEQCRFDAFCKKVLRNEARAYLRNMKRQREREAFFGSLPQEELDKLWTKFYKVDKAHTRSYGGSGIGLSIVKAIMDSHNKECGVENRPDGVSFWFTVDGSSH